LHRIDPEQGIRRFYSLMIEQDLFGTVRLVRNWGMIGTKGQELVEIHADEIEAGQVLDAVARAKRRRRYRDLLLYSSTNLRVGDRTFGELNNCSL
jgi:predicted DNA-binding WGR domain protein